MRKNGFALIVMAVLLTIIGIVIAEFTPLDVAQERKASNKTSFKLVAIKKALSTYYNANGGILPVNGNPLPGPAALDVLPTATSAPLFGTALTSASCGTHGITCCQAEYNYNGHTTPLTACTGDSNNIGASTQVMIGGVPTRTLNLPDDYAFDEWGNRFTYAVDTGLQNNLGVFSMDGTGTLTKKTTIKDNYQTAYTAVSTGTHKGASAFVVSHGKDGAGSYTRSGVLNSLTCAGTGYSATASERENCDGDASFVESNKNSGATNYFDDLTTSFTVPHFLALADITHNTFLVYRTSNNSNPLTVGGTPLSVLGIAYSPDCRYFVTGVPAPALMNIYNTADYTTTISYSGVTSVPIYAAFSHDGSKLALLYGAGTPATDGIIQILSTATWSVTNTINTGVANAALFTQPTDLVFSPDDSMLAVGYQNNYRAVCPCPPTTPTRLVVLKTSDWTNIPVDTQPTNFSTVANVYTQVMKLSFSPDGSKLVAVIGNTASPNTIVASVYNSSLAGINWNRDLTTPAPVNAYSGGFTPSGSSFLVSHSATGATNLYIFSPASWTITSSNTSTSTDGGVYAFSPDFSRMAYATGGVLRMVKTADWLATTAAAPSFRTGMGAQYYSKFAYCSN